MVALAAGAAFGTDAKDLEPAAYACMQTGRINKFPPVIPEAIDIKECTDFLGEPALAKQVGQSWCDHAAQVVLGPKDVPPKVERVSTCPSGWLAMCFAPLPPQGADGQLHPLVVRRHYYVASPGAGGMEGLRETCEAKPKAGQPATSPRGQFLLPGQKPKPF